MTTISTTAPVSVGGDVTANGAVNADNAGIAVGAYSQSCNSGGCTTTTGSAGTCTVTFIGGGATTPGTATVAASGSGVLTYNAPLMISNPGIGYTSLPLTAMLGPSTGSYVCSGVLNVTVTLTPGCLHMQDGQGNDMGVCAPPSGFSGLFNLPPIGAYSMLPFSSAYSISPVVFGGGTGTCVVNFTGPGGSGASALITFSGASASTAINNGNSTIALLTPGSGYNGITGVTWGTESGVSCGPGTPPMTFTGLNLTTGEVLTASGVDSSTYASTAWAAYLSVTRLAGSAGTTVNMLTKLDASGNAVIAATSDVNILGVAQATAASTYPVQVATNGVVGCVADNTIVVGDLVGASTVTAGDCTDLSQTSPSAVSTAVQVVGRALTAGSTGNVMMVQLYGPGQFGSAVSASGISTGILGVAYGGTGTSSTLSGIVRGGNPMTAHELFGDATTSGSNSVTNVAINGTPVPTNSASDQVILTTASATGSWASVPNCADSNGNHLNYLTSTHAFSCGSTVIAPTASTLGGIESLAAVSHEWIYTISTAGVPSASQPACSDLNGVAPSCSTDTTDASNISSGTLGAARLPTPTSSTLGGVESLAAVSHEWINTISTAGVPSATQPACSDISGSVSTCSNVVGLLSSQVDTSTSDGNTVTATAETAFTVTYYTVPAGLLTAGQAIRLTLGFNLSGQAAAGNLQIAVRMGNGGCSPSCATGGTQVFASSAGIGPTNGVSGVGAGMSLLISGTAPATGTPPVLVTPTSFAMPGMSAVNRNALGTSVNLATSGSLDLWITAKWTAGSGAGTDSISLQQFIVEAI